MEVVRDSPDELKVSALNRARFSGWGSVLQDLYFTGFHTRDLFDMQIVRSMRSSRRFPGQTNLNLNISD